MYTMGVGFMREPCANSSSIPQNMNAHYVLTVPVTKIGCI